MEIVELVSAICSLICGLIVGFWIICILCILISVYREYLEDDTIT
jgi:hypothetical protein